jgi:hypothetical protein
VFAVCVVAVVRHASCDAADSSRRQGGFGFVSVRPDVRASDRSGGVRTVHGVSARGPERQYDVEQLFGLFFNGGQRRTLADVEKYARELDPPIEVSYMTLRRYSDDFDWSGRADALDEEARKQADKRIASIVARHRAREVETVAALQTRFMKRLVPSTRENPNPDEIRPGDIEIKDFADLAKLFELLTGGATSRVGQEGPTALEDMARAIAEMDALETPPALPAGKG